MDMESETRKCPFCLKEIPAIASTCSGCHARIKPAAGSKAAPPPPKKAALFRLSGKLSQAAKPRKTAVALALAALGLSAFAWIYARMPAAQNPDSSTPLPSVAETAVSSAGPPPRSQPAVQDDFKGTIDVFAKMLEFGRSGKAASAPADAWSDVKKYLARKEEEARLAKIAEEKRIQEEKERAARESAKMEKERHARELAGLGFEEMDQGDLLAVSEIVNAMFRTRYGKFETYGLDDIRLGMTKQDLKKLGFEGIDNSSEKERRKKSYGIDNEIRREHGDGYGSDAYSLGYDENDRVAYIRKYTTYSLDPRERIYKAFGVPDKENVFDFNINQAGRSVTKARHIAYFFPKTVVCVYIGTDTDSGFSVSVTVYDREYALKSILAYSLLIYDMVSASLPVFKAIHSKMPLPSSSALNVKQVDKDYYELSWTRSVRRPFVFAAIRYGYRGIYMDIMDIGEPSISSHLAEKQIYHYPPMLAYKCIMDILNHLYRPVSPPTKITKMTTTSHGPRFPPSISYSAAYLHPIAGNHTIALLLDDPDFPHSLLQVVQSERETDWK